MWVYCAEVEKFDGTAGITVGRLAVHEQLPQASRGAVPIKQSENIGYLACLQHLLGNPLPLQCHAYKSYLNIVVKICRYEQ